MTIARRWVINAYFAACVLKKEPCSYVNIEMEKVRVQIQKQTAVFVMARSEIAFLCRTLCTWCAHLHLCGFKKYENRGIYMVFINMRTRGLIR